MPKLIDLTGQKFGRLTVLERDKIRKGVAWICKCDCGKIVSRLGGSLRSGQALSCGCLKDERHRKDLTNQKFGELTAIEYGKTIYEKSGDKIATWRCKCNCGNVIDVPTFYLTNGITRSCGCCDEFDFHKNF